MRRIERLAEKADRLHGRWERRLDLTAQVSIPRAVRPVGDEVHELLGVPTSCPTCRGFDRVWDEIMSRVPRASVHDGGRGLAEALWITARHRRPEQAVETGVAQGVSSAVILAAMEANGHGRLWSIDLPPAEGWGGQVGVGVPPRLHGRWSYLRAGSRRRLPGLAHRLETFDLFLHDALHTYQSMSREFGLAWRRLRPGGVLVSDDVDANPAFLDFVEDLHSPWLALGEAAGKSTAFGVALRD